MADVRRSWKYEKDVFGRKHRKYFLESVFGADTFDMKTFRALRVKMSRDYTTFFQGLDRRYERGEFKQVAKEAQKIVREVISILDSMIDSGLIDKRDVDGLVERIGFLNDQRDLIVQKAGQVKALQERLSSIEQETGATPEALNVTGKIVRRGAKRETQKGKEGAAHFLKRTMPRSLGMGGEVLGGLGTAALGPFAPIAKMVGGVGADIFGLGKGLVQKVGERKERRLGRMLAPFSGERPSEGGFGGSTMTGGASKGRTERRREGSSVLMDFFNRGAFRAKWTKELLKKMKGVGVKGAEGLSNMFSGLVSAILPLIGAAGLLATLGVGIKGVMDALEYFKAQKGRKEAAVSLGKAAAQRLDVMKKMGGKEFAEKAGKPFFKVAMEQAALERRSKEEYMEAAKPWWLRGMEKTPVGGLVSKFVEKKAKKAIGIKPDWQRAAEIIEETDKRTQQQAQFRVPGETKRKEIPSEVVVELLTAIKKLDEAALGLSKNVGKTNRTDAARQPGIGNIYDSADVLLNELAGGGLEEAF